MLTQNNYIEHTETVPSLSVFKTKNLSEAIYRRLERWSEY